MTSQDFVDLLPLEQWCVESDQCVSDLIERKSTEHIKAVLQSAGAWGEALGERELTLGAQSLLKQLSSLEQDWDLPSRELGGSVEDFRLIQEKMRYLVWRTQLKSQ
jgi:hypothetical protein